VGRGGGAGHDAAVEAAAVLNSQRDGPVHQTTPLPPTRPRPPTHPPTHPLQAVITRSATDVLSHVAIRARSQVGARALTRVGIGKHIGL
jgi:hypothetical protein